MASSAFKRYKPTSFFCRDLQSPILNLHSAPLLAQCISAATGKHLLLGIIIFNLTLPQAVGSGPQVRSQRTKRQDIKFTDTYLCLTGSSVEDRESQCLESTLKTESTKSEIIMNFSKL